jgi:organic hydroperoxide reductase OsmC/OhrA
MSRTAKYRASVTWKGGHRGHVRMGNGPEMEFSAPPDSHGLAGVFTPEDAFVAAVNTCVMMMFLWTAERYKIDLVSYDCEGEGTKRIELDRTEIFEEVMLRPRIVVRGGDRDPGQAEKRILRALESARKYSLVANSVKSRVSIEPEIVVAT